LEVGLLLTYEMNIAQNDFKEPVHSSPRSNCAPHSSPVGWVFTSPQGACMLLFVPSDTCSVHEVVGERRTQTGGCVPNFHVQVGHAHICCPSITYPMDWTCASAADRCASFSLPVNLYPRVMAHQQTLVNANLITAKCIQLVSRTSMCTSPYPILRRSLPLVPPFTHSTL